jgi:polyisoprenoid-binding protein YceI
VKLMLLAVLTANISLAADYRLPLTPATKIEWTLSDPLHTVHGTFKLKRGGVIFDPESGKAGGEIVVDVASGDSGSGTRDSRVHANVLESGKYPEASFHSRSHRGNDCAHRELPGQSPWRVPNSWSGP